MEELCRAQMDGIEDIYFTFSHLEVEQNEANSEG